MPKDTADQPLRPGLYIVATPIGNLGDLSPRASHVLASASLVAAEDTRTSRKLPPLAGTSTPMVSLTEHNFEGRKRQLLYAARAGVVAVISDAGTPGIADPGSRLVAAALDEGITVVAVPGPSALAAALSVSGAGPGAVAFLGFLPRQVSKRLAMLEKLPLAGIETAVFLESPGRVADSLRSVAEAFADPLVVVCRELTKLHEEVVRGRASELAQQFEDTRGEFTVVVHIPPAEHEEAGLAEVRAYMEEMQRAGAHRSGAAAEAVRRFGVARAVAYACWAGSDDAPE